MHKFYKPEVPYKTVSSFYFREPSPHTLIGSNRPTIASYTKRAEPLSSIEYNRNVNVVQNPPVLSSVINTPQNRHILSGMEREVKGNEGKDLSGGLYPSLHYGTYTPQKSMKLKDYQMNTASSIPPLLAPTKEVVVVKKEKESPLSGKKDASGCVGCGQAPFGKRPLHEGFVASAVGGVVDDKKANPGNIRDPAVFGPPLWFALHTTAAHYPENPSPAVQAKMKGLILGLPLMVPCAECFEHCTSYIEKAKDKLDEIVSNRQHLFKFFVDFHNAVNRRKHKPEMSLEDAWKLYT